MSILDRLRQVPQLAIRTDVAVQHASPEGTPAMPARPGSCQAMSPRSLLSRRHRLPVRLVRLLGADCVECRGIGCPECAHTGLG